MVFKDEEFMKCKVNNVNFNSAIPTIAATRQIIDDKTLIRVIAYDNTNFVYQNTISITLTDITETGLYNLSSATINSSFLLSYTDGQVDYNFTSISCDGYAVLNITYIDNNKIEGTFSVLAKNEEDCSGESKNLTEGSFRGFF